MKLGKKLLAVICTVSVLLAMVVIPASAFTGSTATMPETFSVIDDFESGISGSGTNSWIGVGTGATYETSTDYGYGTTGNSLKVSLSPTNGWTGAKTNAGAYTVVNDGIAFWIYLPEGIASGKTFAVCLRLGMTAGSMDTKYEAKVNVSKLTAGEHIITIPWSDFELKSGTATFTNAGIAVTQVEFTCNDTGKVYYLDQLGMYKGNATQSTFVPSTKKMPNNYTVIENFDSTNTLGWQANKTTLEFSTVRGYGATGKSLHISDATGGWCGFKTSGAGRNITLTGDGLAFWTYNAGAENNRLYVKLTSNGVAYEKQITLKSGEEVYKIAWSEFKKDEAAIDISKTVTQIEFTSGNAVADYYVDEISCYSDYIASKLTMPTGFTVIDDFNGENTLGWASTNKATLKIAAERGYGTSGKGAHISWNESGWSGMKTASGKNITLTDDGLAFWAYNAGSELTNFAVVLVQDSVKYEAKITLKAGEAIYKIPFSNFVKGDATVDTTKSVSQMEFTKSAASADYFIDQIGCYAEPKKPTTSTVLFDTSVKSSSSAVAGSGNGGKGGFDTVKWKLYDIKNDPRFTRACHFIAEDVTSGVFNMANVTKIGALDGVDISSAYNFGNLNFWIKSDTANRTLKVGLKDKTSSKYSDCVEFTVTVADKWQQITIPIKDIISEEFLTSNPDFLKNVDVVSFTGKDVKNTFKFGEEFKIAGLKIWSSDVPDYSEYAQLDTEPTQPEDDGSYNANSEVIGSIDFTMDTYSGNSGFGKVTKMQYDDFATTQNGIKIVVGDGIRNDKMATKGLSAWFGENGTAKTIDFTTLEDGYFSMWVRGNRAGMSFYYILFDDTDNDAKTSIVRTYTVKKANTWEEVRIRICDFVPDGALDNEYVYKMQIRTGYGQFNWSKAYQDEQWLNTGDILEVAAANVTEGKPIDAFTTVIVDNGKNNGDADAGDKSDNNGGSVGDNTGTNNNSGSDDNGKTENTVTDTTSNDNTAISDNSPKTGESVVNLVMLLTFACINGLIAAFAQIRIKVK